jgi:hypothetical protein
MSSQGSDVVFWLAMVSYPLPFSLPSSYAIIDFEYSTEHTPEKYPPPRRAPVCGFGVGHTYIGFVAESSPLSGSVELLDERTQKAYLSTLCKFINESRFEKLFAWAAKIAERRVFQEFNISLSVPIEELQPKAYRYKPLDLYIEDKGIMDKFPWLKNFRDANLIQDLVRELFEEVERLYPHIPEPLRNRITEGFRNVLRDDEKMRGCGRLLNELIDFMNTLGEHCKDAKTCGVADYIIASIASIVVLHNYSPDIFTESYCLLEKLSSREEVPPTTKHHDVGGLLRILGGKPNCLQALIHILVDNNDVHPLCAHIKYHERLGNYFMRIFEEIKDYSLRVKEELADYFIGKLQESHPQQRFIHVYTSRDVTYTSIHCEECCEKCVFTHYDKGQKR